MLLINTDKSCREQHEAVRNAVGVYYFTHRVIEVTGPDACALLDRMYVSRISKLEPTRGRYTMLLTEEGIPQDDCVISRVDEDTYWISTLHVPRILTAAEEVKGDLDANMEVITKKWDMFSIQGPKADEVAVSLVKENPTGLKRFQIVDNKLNDIDIKIAKGGYTGEGGYEIYCRADQTEAVQKILFEAAEKFGGRVVDEFDVMAYTLATEAGLYLVTDFDEATPFETGMDWMIDWSKDAFYGREAVLAMKDQPLKNKLVGITVDSPFVKVHGGPYGGQVSKNGRVIGRVTKFTYGFTVDKWVGFALIDAAYAVNGEHVTIDWDVDAEITDVKILKK